MIMGSGEKRSITYETHLPDRRKLVRFYPEVFVYEFVDDNYDRTSTPMAILETEDLEYLDRLRTLMQDGQYITDNPNVPAAPLPSRKMYFENFVRLWKKRVPDGT